MFSCCLINVVQNKQRQARDFIHSDGSFQFLSLLNNYAESIAIHYEYIMKCVKSEKIHLKFKLKIKRKKRQQTNIPHFSICKAQKQKNKI